MSLYAYLLGLLLLRTASGETVFGWQELSTKLPRGVSDHTATRSGDIVYLAGGCDAEQGNVWDEGAKFFKCFSISKALIGFDIDTKTIIDDLPDMPIPRYRHAAVAANNKIWVVGGRDIDDNLIDQVDVGSWNIAGDLPAEYVASDNTGFGYQNRAYFIGGYGVNYTALTNVFYIDAAAPDPLGSITEVAPLNVERGDIAAAIDEVTGYVLVAGGFTHANDFCEPHKHAEMYNIAADEWVEIAPLQYGRADKALVHLDGQDGVFYALGGERQVMGFCDLDVQPEPGERTIPIDQVERYNKATDTWETVSDLPLHRFRFPAVAEGNDIYSFGGQVAFDQECDCFDTTDTIIVYTEVESWASTLSLVLNGILATASAFWLTGLMEL
eukprot:scaffold9322_cov168-Amphora_coffeaeformis.AAC.5